MQEGLLLKQPKDSRLDSTIHMMTVFTELAVFWINSRGDVVDKVLARPWHLVYTPRASARYVLEIHPSKINEFSIGDKVSFSDE